MSQASLCTAHSASQSLRSMPAGARDAWRGRQPNSARVLTAAQRARQSYSTHPRLEASSATLA